MHNLLRVIGCIVLASISAISAAKDSRDRDKVTSRDYFFYSCVHEYLHANGIRNFDGSLGYAVEYSDLDPDELEKLYDAAKVVAKGIRAPDYADPEHGLPAVLMLCEKAAAKQ